MASNANRNNKANNNTGLRLVASDGKKLPKNRKINNDDFHVDILAKDDPLFETGKNLLEAYNFMKNKKLKPNPKKINDYNYMIQLFRVMSYDDKTTEVTCCVDPFGRGFASLHLTSYRIEEKDKEALDEIYRIADMLSIEPEMNIEGRNMTDKYAVVIEGCINDVYVL